MGQVNWWLFALSFAAGLGLTFVLVVRSMKQQARVSASANESEPPTTLISEDADSPTTMIHGDQDSPTMKIPAAKDAPTTKIPAGVRAPAGKRPAKRTAPAKGSATRKIPAAPYAPFGPGSARARADGSGPAGWFVKGRSDTRLYYTPDDPVFDRTVAQVWFKDTESAARAFFTPWRESSKKR